LSSAKPKGRKKQTYLEWWQSRLQTLAGFKDEARGLYEKTGVAYPVGAWAILKLALVAYYVDLYSSIIKSNFERSYYVDFFAGPGLNQIRETGDIVLGSPLLADRVPKKNKKFDHLILVESDPDKSKALQTLLPSARVLPYDSNSEGITKVLASIPSKSIPGLVFVDPEGVELQWNTLEIILGQWCDVMINFQTSSISRITDNIHADALDAFYGIREWRNCVGGDNLLRLYVQRLSAFRDFVIPVRVQGPGVFHYHIIIGVRKTQGSQDWVDAIYRARDKIEQATSRDAEHFLDIKYKRQASLTDFGPRL